MGNPFKSNPRIFVVDDEVQIAKMLVVILQMNMFDAVPYSDPEAALQAAKQDPPDYLISDVVMPGSSERAYFAGCSSRRKLPNRAAKDSSTNVWETGYADDKNRIRGLYSRAS